MTAMPDSVTPKRADPEPLDLLAAIRRHDILDGRKLEQAAVRVCSGEYPRDPAKLARRLVDDGSLTGYQARHILHGNAPNLTFDRYVLLDRIGQGAMGRVYRARHRLTGRIVALKAISEGRTDRRRAVSRFRREMRLAGRLDHPNVVRTLDAGRFRGMLYIAMEYVPGRDLGRLLDECGPLRPADAVRYAAQAARGLEHAHALGVIHRDVKPTNLILGDDGRVRVIDLGLGALMDREDEGPEAFATAVGLAVGTVEYMSPEQAAGRPADGRSDLYNLGCTMYHLLTARLPFPGDSQVECMAMRIKGRPEPIRSVRPDLPASLDRVLDRLLATRPADRYQDAGEAALALEALLRPRAARSGAVVAAPGGPAAREACAIVSPPLEASPSGPTPLLARSQSRAPGTAGHIGGGADRHPVRERLGRSPRGHVRGIDHAAAPGAGIVTTLGRPDAGADRPGPAGIARIVPAVSHRIDAVSEESLLVSVTLGGGLEQVRRRPSLGIPRACSPGRLLELIRGGIATVARRRQKTSAP